MNPRCLMMAVSAIALSGCVSAGDSTFLSSQGFAPDGHVSPSFAPGASAMTETDLASSATEPASGNVLVDAMQSAVAEGAAPEGTAAEPGAAALRIPVPTASPAYAGNIAEANATLASLAPAQTAPGTIDALNRGISQTAERNPAANIYSEGSAAPVADQTAGQASATPEPQSRPIELAVVEPPKQKSFFARLFNLQPSPPKSVPEGPAKEPVRLVSASAGGAALPGVNTSSLYEIQSGTEEDGEETAEIEMASAAGLARLSPNGLHVQTERVDVACLRPQLLKLLNRIETHYGRPVVVTSGYRSPRHNRRIGGASGSKHTSCEAADIQIDGVTKWQLAKFLRTMPDRGGVGTYCHTESVHVDTGSPRDWNWRCRRRK